MSSHQSGICRGHSSTHLLQQPGRASVGPAGALQSAVTARLSAPPMAHHQLWLDPLPLVPWPPRPLHKPHTGSTCLQQYSSTTAETAQQYSGQVHPLWHLGQSGLITHHILTVHACSSTAVHQHSSTAIQQYSSRTAHCVHRRQGATSQPSRRDFRPVESQRVSVQSAVHPASGWACGCKLGVGTLAAIR